MSTHGRKYDINYKFNLIFKKNHIVDGNFDNLGTLESVKSKEIIPPTSQKYVRICARFPSAFEL